MKFNISLHGTRLHVSAWSVPLVLPCTPGSSDSPITLNQLKCMQVLGQLFDADEDVFRN